MGLQPAAAGEEGPLQLRRDTLGDVVVGPGPVVQALGAGLQVAAPPLVEPGLGAAQRRAEVLDGPAGEAQTEGALARREFVVPAVLRGAAAGGCPRRWFYTGGGGAEAYRVSRAGAHPVSEPTGALSA